MARSPIRLMHPITTENMKIDSQLYTRLCKIHQLSIKGVGGEADNARQLLADLLERNGLTMADFEAQGEEKIDYAVKIDKENVLFKLFYQIAHSVGLNIRVYDKPTIDKVVAQSPRDQRKFIRAHFYKMIGSCELCGTASQIEEFKLQWEIYSEACMEEIKTTVIAFIHANSIFPPDDGSDKGERPPLTDIQKRALMRAMEMESVQIRRRLNSVTK